MPLYDYYCQKCDIKFEAMNKIDERNTTECSTCHSICKQVPSPVRSKLDPISGDFPGATMQWEKNHSQKLAQERKTGNHEEY
jgi:putative FmdB family regulatory protein